MQHLSNQEVSFGPYLLKRGGRTLAKSLAFSLSCGSYLEILGANGAGKTSLLRALAGLGLEQGEEAGSGANNAHEYAASTFYFSHQPGFRPELTVIAQLTLSLQMLGVPAEQQALQAPLKALGLHNLQFAQIRTLSQGQGKRLALLIMILSQRSLWLIDEPLNALDSQASALFEDALKQHLTKGGMAVIATHQRLHEVHPNLAAYASGQLNLNAGTYAVEMRPMPSGMQKPTHPHAFIRLSAWQTFTWSLLREWICLAAKPADVLWPALFFAMVLTMFPFTLEANTQGLQTIATGVFWMSALLSILMAAQRLFQVDEEQGALVQMYCAKLSIPALCAAKIIANWLFIALPILILTYLCGLLYHLPLHMMHQLALAMGLGLLSLTGLMALFASLSLMARQSQVMMSILALPVFVPLLIFGAAASTSGAAHMMSAPMWVMFSLSVLTLLTMPFLSAQALTLAIE